MFDIQLFADTVISSSTGSLVVEFYDGDNRTLPVDNPRDDLTAAEINAFVETLKINQPIIGDKTGASVVGASKFTITDKVEVKFDLSE